MKKTDEHAEEEPTEKKNFVARPRHEKRKRVGAIKKRVWGKLEKQSVREV